jgi:two-component system alkaline phosphatase synthesis response regulator PhoP
MNRVLVVDDEKSILEVISDMINKLGFTPLTASSAEEGLKVFQKERPGIVMADLKLGRGMDGVALCSRVKYEDPSVIFIAVSGYFSEYDKVFCLSAGFTDFLVKPVDANELNSALQCAFDRRIRWNKIP